MKADAATLAFTHLVLACMRVRATADGKECEQAVADAARALAQLEHCLRTADVPNVGAVARFVCELEEAER